MGPEREMRVGTLLSTLAINDSLALVGRAVDLASQSTYVRYGIVLNLLLITACTELYAKIDGKPPSNTARSTFHMTTVQKQMLKRLTSTSSQLKPIPITKTPPSLFPLHHHHLQAPQIFPIRTTHHHTMLNSKIAETPPRQPSSQTHASPTQSLRPRLKPFLKASPEAVQLIPARK